MAFQDATNICKLVDLGFQGAAFTWTNNRDVEAHVQGRLDRAMATATWLECFPAYKVTHVAGTVSDHLALLVSLKARQGTQRRKKVVRRFEEKWATVPACEEVIRSAWQQTVTGGSPMFELSQKITRCRHALCD